MAKGRLSVADKVGDIVNQKNPGKLVQTLLGEKPTTEIARRQSLLHKIKLSNPELNKHLNEAGHGHALSQTSK